MCFTITQPVQRMVGRGMAQKIVGCLMEFYKDVLQNSLLSCILLCFFAIGLGRAYSSAAIIMIFVSCTNNIGYLRNYQNCLTLGLHESLVFLQPFTRARVTRVVVDENGTRLQ
jgi:hypothetical protein